MRAIRISDQVWQEIAKRGVFGETEDDVLKRVFEIEGETPPSDNEPQSGGGAPAAVRSPPRQHSKRGRFASNKMHTKVHSGNSTDYLLVSFEDGDARNQWDLPADRSDKSSIRAVMNAALSFGEMNEASKGQLMAIRKALTDAGYHLIK